MTINERKRIVREIGVIILLSVFLALIYNTFSRKGIPLIRKEILKVSTADSILFSSPTRMDTSRSSIGTSDTIPSPPNSDAKVIAPLHEKAMRNLDSMAELYAGKRDPVFKIINLQQLKRLIAEGRGILFDARDPNEYRRGHIKNARSIPGLEADQHFNELISIPRDTLIIIYCNNTDCHLGHMLADFMHQLDFINIFLYDDGWDGWVEAKMPIDTTTTIE
ncbi:MAG: rhodanese-like domain-containing protein [Bacteroidota bacterium]|nr:rhodanese-like domain-containing protein [Bacteroidota bacterium]